MASANTNGTAVAYVQMQTLAANNGHTAALAVVQAAITAHNAANPKQPHVMVSVPALPNNTKGMQYMLSLYATVARLHGATVIRLGVHGGAVVICGPQAAVNATQASLVPANNVYSTMATNAWQATGQTNGKVGYTNAYACGLTAGLQVASKVSPMLAYGIGKLFTFTATSTHPAYTAGQAAATKAGTSVAQPPKAAKAATAPTATAPTAAQPATTATTATTASAA